MNNSSCELENEGREATLKNDIEANDRLLADNWVNINPDGSVTTKAKLMELLKDGSFKIMSIDNDEVMVRVYGDAAVVTGRSTTKRAGQGGEVMTRQVRFTRVYAKGKERWQVVSAHNTLISSRSWHARESRSWKSSVSLLVISMRFSPRIEIRVRPSVTTVILNPRYNILKVRHFDSWARMTHELYSGNHPIIGKVRMYSSITCREC